MSRVALRRPGGGATACLLAAVLAGAGGPILGASRGLAAQQPHVLTVVGLGGDPDYREAFLDWGWRVPFVTSVIIAGAGLWVRLGVPEPPAFQQMKDAGDLEQQPLRTALREHPKEILITAGLNWPVSAGYYIVFVWITSDLNKVVGLPLSTTLAINSAGLLFATLMAPLLGALSDRIGPRQILAAAGIVATAASAPLLLLAGLGPISAALAAQIALALIMAGYLSVLPTVFVSLHSARVRCSSLSIGYNIAVMVFGGTAPLTATVLIRWTGWQPEYFGWDLGS